MKWLIVGASLVAAALALWVLAAERRPGHARSSVRGLAAAIAALVIFGAIVYFAHYAGFFSLPILAVAFIPFGLSARWLVLATREMRERREAAAPPPPPTFRERVMAVAFWPIFVLLVLLVAALGLVAGIVGSYR